MSAAQAGNLPDGCPPDDAVPAQGTFYRLASKAHALGDNTVAGDWNLPLSTPGSQGYRQVDLCVAHAFSIFDNLGGLLIAREAVPFARKKSVAQVELDPSMGVTKETPTTVWKQGHHSWWPSGTAAPAATVVAEPSPA